MRKIVEIYPDAQEVKQQVEYRKVFGWDSKVRITDRGVYEVTFTRSDDAKSNKLENLENEFMQCSTAEDYIERYGEINVNKKKFRSMHPIILILVIYFIFSFILQGVVLGGLGALYKADPAGFIGEGFEVSVDGEPLLITQDWSYEVDLEKLGVYGVALMFGVTEKTVSITVDTFMTFSLWYGVGNIALAFILLYWAIKKKINANTYYKAEVEYVENRQELLNDKLDFLNDEMDRIIVEAKKLA